MQPEGNSHSKISRSAVPRGRNGYVIVGIKVRGRSQAEINQFEDKRKRSQQKKKGNDFRPQVRRAVEK